MVKIAIAHGTWNFNENDQHDRLLDMIGDCVGHNLAKEPTSDLEAGAAFSDSEELREFRTGYHLEQMADDFDSRDMSDSNDTEPRNDCVSALGTAAMLARWDVVEYLSDLWQIDWGEGNSLEPRDQAYLSREFFSGAIEQDHVEMVQRAIDLGYDPTDHENWDCGNVFPFRSIPIVVGILDQTQIDQIMQHLVTSLVWSDARDYRVRALQVIGQYTRLDRILERTFQMIEDLGAPRSQEPIGYCPVETIRMLAKRGVPITSSYGPRWILLLREELVSDRWAIRRFRPYQSLLNRQEIEQIRLAALEHNCAALSQYLTN